MRSTLQAVDDPRIKHLRDLCEQAIKLKDAAEQLVTELTHQLERSVSTHDDKGSSPLSEPRRKPRI
jgi:hypothetical protein